MYGLLTGNEAPLEWYDHPGGWCIVDRDPVRKSITLCHIEERPDGDVVHMRELQDAEALVAENTAERNETAGQRYGEGLTKVASIPMNVWANRLAEPTRQGDTKFLDRWLNDPDHAAFKVRDGRI